MYAAVTWYDITDIALARSEMERLLKIACIMIRGVMRINPIKVLEVLLDLTTFGTAIEFAALMAAYDLPMPDLRNLGIGHNWIRAKADKVDNKFTMIKDNVNLRRTFDKYLIVIPTSGEEWVKKRTKSTEKGMSGLHTHGACNQQGTCKYQRKLQWHISLGQDATAFQVGVAAILDCVTSCLRKRLVIYTHSQVAVAALGASGTKSRLVADCVEKQTAMSEVNQVTIMWVPGRSGIQQKETTDKLGK